jgi:hypothetical protein
MCTSRLARGGLQTIDTYMCTLRAVPPALDDVDVPQEWVVDTWSTKE